MSDVLICDHVQPHGASVGQQSNSLAMGSQRLLFANCFGLAFGPGFFLMSLSLFDTVLNDQNTTLMVLSFVFFIQKTLCAGFVCQPCLHLLACQLTQLCLVDTTTKGLMASIMRNFNNSLLCLCSQRIFMFELRVQIVVRFFFKRFFFHTLDVGTGEVW